MHDEPGRPDNEQGAEDAGREFRTDGIADEQGGGERRETAGEAIGERSDPAAETGEAGAGPEAGTGASSDAGSGGGRWGDDEQGYQRWKAPPPPKRLTRSQHDRVLGGVAAGVAEYFNVDPLLVRLAFVLVTLFSGGVGALGYLIAWAAIPASPGLPDELSHRRRILQIWLLVAGALLLVAPLGAFVAATGFHPFRPSALLLGLALIGAGVLLFLDDARRQRTGDGLPPPPAPHGPGRTPGYPAAPSGYAASATTAPAPGSGYASSRTTQPVSSERERGSATADTAPAAPSTSGEGAGVAPSGAAAGDAPGGAAAGAEVGPDVSPAAGMAGPDRPGSAPFGSGRGSMAGAGRAPATREGSSMLGRGVVGVVLIVLGLAAAVDMLDIVELRLTAYLALALLVVGAGLLVGAWRGRSRGLIIFGLALVPPLLVASVLPFPLEGGFGERVVHVNTLSEVDNAYRLAAGRLLLDVSEVRFPAGETELEASVGAGEIEVVVPPDVTVILDAQLRAGEVSFFGENIDVTPADRVLSGGWGAERRGMEDGEQGGWTPPLDDAPFRWQGRPGSRWHGAGNQLMLVDEGREGAGTLRLRLRAGMGELIVRRGPAL